MTVATRARAASVLLALLLAACDREPQARVRVDPAANQADAGQVNDVDPKALTPGPVRHESLTDEQMARVRRVTEALKEVEHNPIEVWVDNFKRDLNPDAEIQVWENIAAAYAAYTGGKSLTQDAKEDVFRALLLRSMMPAEEVLPRLKLKALSQEQARDVMALYTAPGKPITVIRE